MTANDAIVTLVNYLELAQSRGVFSLREASEIMKSIDVLATPAPQPEPEQKSQDSEEPGSQE